MIIIDPECLHIVLPLSGQIAGVKGTGAGGNALSALSLKYSSLASEGCLPTEQA